MTWAPALVAEQGGDNADALAARAYAFLAAALASSGAPTPDALAAEIAHLLGVPSLAVLHGSDRGRSPVIAFGFPSTDVAGDVGVELLDEAQSTALPVASSLDEARNDATGLRSVLVLPIHVAGQPWGVLVVASGVREAFDARTAARAEAIASGLGVVLGPLVPDTGGLALSRERRLRLGFEAVVQVVAGIVEDATPAAAARSLAEALHHRLGWERILIASHRPSLGLVPLAVAGTHVEIADVLTGGTFAETSAFEPVTDGVATQPMFDGSVSQILLPLGHTPVGLSGVLSVESHHGEAFDDVDLELARAVAGLAGPLFGRLGLRNERRALAVRVEQADRRQRRRFTSLAHELRTPITVMLGYADLLADRDPAEEQRREYAQTLARHARALGRMVDNALVAWQLDDGSLELSVADVPVTDAVAEAVASLGMAPDLVGLEGIRVRADAFWLPRVIGALLDNARRYVTDGNVRISARQDGDRVRIAVHDDGPGIDADDLMRVFDAFHRGEDGGIGPHRGVGLGLTVARALSRAMGGDLDVASATDYGTTFTIELASA